MVAGVSILFACEQDPLPGPGGYVTEKLEPPTNVECSSIAITALTFGWQSIPGATSFEVMIAPQNNPDNTTVSETTGTSYEFTNLSAATTYIFSIRCLYSYNSEFNSDYLQITATTRDYEILTPPENVKWSNRSENGITISWSAVTDAVTYRVSVVADESGSEDGNEVVSGTSCTFDGLTRGTKYTAYVKALFSDGSEETRYDSEASTVSFQTLPAPMTAPPLYVVYLTHGLLVWEWDYTSEMLSEKKLHTATAYGDTDGEYSDDFNIRMLDASGNVLRTTYVDRFFFRDYPYYRIAWGGLDAGTTYTVQMSRVQIDSSSLYLDSEYSGLEFTTEAAPNTSDYLLYWDWDNVPFNANYAHIAYGFKRPTDSNLDWSNPWNLNLSWGYTDNSIGVQGDIQNLGQNFFDQYLPGLSISDYIATSTSHTAGTSCNLSVQAGNLRMGNSGSSGSWIHLPGLENISSNSSVVLEFDAMNYSSPGTGDVWSTWDTADNGPVYVEIPSTASFGDITNDHGKSASYEGNTATLQILTRGEMKTYEDADPFAYNHCTLEINGLNPGDEVIIHSLYGERRRMLIDSVTMKLK